MSKITKVKLSVRVKCPSSPYMFFLFIQVRLQPVNV